MAPSSMPRRRSTSPSARRGSPTAAGRCAAARGGRRRSTRGPAQAYREALSLYIARRLTKGELDAVVYRALGKANARLHNARPRRGPRPSLPVSRSHRPPRRRPSCSRS